MKDIVRNEIIEHQEVSSQLVGLTDVVVASAKMCIECLNHGGKILIFGNGGSAADAQHFAAELVGRYKKNRKGIPAIALTTDSSCITSISNDFGYHHIFERQIEALAKEGDVAIGISTSGKSENVLRALKLASELDCMTIGLSGKKDADMKKICNLNIASPTLNTPRVQETHIVICHIICNLIEQKFQN